MELIELKYPTLAYNVVYTDFLSDLSTTQLKKLKEKAAILVIYLIDEGDIDIECITQLENTLIKYSIDFNNFILVHDCFDIPYTKFKTFYYQTHLFRKANDTYKLLELNLLSNNTIRNKKYKFHIPIRRLRKHRIILLEKLFEYNSNFIENNLISYDIEFENNKTYLSYCNNTTFIDYLNNKKHQYIDVNDFNSILEYSHHLTNNEQLSIKEIYNTSYFTIITETMFYDKFNYISEKIWKVIAQQHPFIIVGRPNTLKYIKSLGFKTFDDIIDESYDDETDDNVRMQKIINEIIKLNSYNKNELDAILDRVANVLSFNQLHLANLHKFSSHVNTYKFISMCTSDKKLL